ncbi:hypothetical protein QL285_016798 [Trifolium repens]|nr:hypothetical protein QL285_016798 [Trifolium repens]
MFLLRAGGVFGDRFAVFLFGFGVFVSEIRQWFDVLCNGVLVVPVISFRGCSVHRRPRFPVPLRFVVFVLFQFDLFWFYSVCSVRSCFREILCFPFLFFLLHGFSSVVPGEDSVSCFLFPFFVRRVSAPSHGRFFRFCVYVTVFCGSLAVYVLDHRRF